MPVIVRRVRPDDWPRLRDVRLAALADAPTAFGSTHEREAAYTDDVWIERAEAGSVAEQRVTFVGDDGTGGPFVGIVGGFLESDGTIHLVSMWTHPSIRRNGLGRRLVEAVLDWAGERRVYLWVTGGNAPAQRLYEAMGFEVTGDVQPHPNDPCRDEVRMTRRR